MIEKRIIVLVTPAQQAAIKAKAQKAGLSVSNYIRQCVGLPLERHGVAKEGKK